MKFLKVRCTKNDFHIVRVDLIERVSPTDAGGFKSKIITGDTELRSIDSQEEIYEKLQVLSEESDK